MKASLRRRGKSSNAGRPPAHAASPPGLTITSWGEHEDTDASPREPRAVHSQVPPKERNGPGIVCVVNTCPQTVSAGLPAAGDDVASPVPHQSDRLVEPEEDGTTTTPVGLAVNRPKSNGRRTSGRVLLGLVLLALTVAAGWGWDVARQQTTIAQRWRHGDLRMLAFDQKMVSMNNRFRSTLNTAEDRVVALDGRVSALAEDLRSEGAALSSANNQLAVVANEKEKEKDQNAVLSTLLKDAGSVSSNLQSCVSEIDSAWDEVTTDLEEAADGDFYGDPFLSSDVSTAVSDCESAETANDLLQSAIASELGK